MVGETYAVGDGTDRWCDSDNLVDNALFSGGAYIPPTCAGMSCLEFRNNVFYTMTGDHCSLKGYSGQWWSYFMCSD